MRVCVGGEQTAEGGPTGPVPHPKRKMAGRASENLQSGGTWTSVASTDRPTMNASGGAHCAEKARSDARALGAATAVQTETRGGGVAVG